MKKYLTFVLMALLSFIANAQPSNISSLDQVAYFKNTTLQIGSTGKIDLEIKYPAEWNIGSIQYHYTLPDGITLKEVRTEGSYTAPKHDGEYSFLGSLEGKYTIATLIVEVSPDMQPGEYNMSIDDYMMADALNPKRDIVGENIISTLTVQKTAVIEEMPDGFGVTIIPFVAKDGDVTLNFNYKSPVNIKTLSFDVELPEGIFYVDDEEWDASKTVSSLKASCTGTPTLSHSLAAGDAPTSAKITVAGTYTNKSKKYINASEDVYSPLAEISACVMTQKDIDEYEWKGDIMTEGIYTIKLSNIVLEDVEGNTYTGEYLASVIYGQPAAQEAILYGNYDETTASAFTKALRNVAFANTTAATFAEGALLEDVILTKDNTNITSYTRTSENYGTTVLPYDLEEDLNCTLYTVKDISSESIVIEETDFVAANTPCIFKGTITAYGEFVPTLGAIDDQTVGLIKFKGTYEATELADGEGYYISGGAFYGDHASISPFRAYFKGAVNGVKSFSVKVDTPNGLIDITNQLSDEAIYSLQGIRMSNAQKGINIKGGKKVYVK